MFCNTISCIWCTFFCGAGADGGEDLLFDVLNGSFLAAPNLKWTYRLNSACTALSGFAWHGPALVHIVKDSCWWALSATLSRQNVVPVYSYKIGEGKAGHSRVAGGPNKHPTWSEAWHSSQPWRAAYDADLFKQHYQKIILKNQLEVSCSATCNLGVSHVMGEELEEEGTSHSISLGVGVPLEMTS